jgi:hypothetical protein
VERHTHKPARPLVLPQDPLLLRVVAQKKASNAAKVLAVFGLVRKRKANVWHENCFATVFVQRVKGRATEVLTVFGLVTRKKANVRHEHGHQHKVLCNLPHPPHHRREHRPLFHNFATVFVQRVKGHATEDLVVSGRVTRKKDGVFLARANFEL